MDIDLRGKRAIVCGSTKGIGKAAALELASLGCGVTLVARDEQALNKVQSELSSASGQKHSHIAADFSDPEGLRKKILAFAANAPPIHILVNNTGGPKGGAVLDAELEEFRSTFAQHLLCNHILVQAVVGGMRAEGYGRIINIISTSVRQPIINLGVSNTIRAAVAGWAKTLANELGPYGITVNNVLPGSTKTTRIDQVIQERAKRLGQSPEQVRAGMIAEIPAGRFADPAELAYAIAFLASPAAAYINGVSLPVDGGRTSSL
jgi:3-oxoacyl-[acyl-carrier protein] reductase